MSSPPSSPRARSNAAAGRPVPREVTRREQQIRRRRAGALLGIALAVIAGAALTAGGGKPPRTQAQAGSTAAPHATRAGPARVEVRTVQSGVLPAAEQDAAAVVISPDRLLLLGGIAETESSLASTVSTNGSHAGTIGTLPTALHDACASFVDGAAYLFGGGVISSFAQITRISASGATQPAGQLPTPASDVACATIGETVYIVGGYTGVKPLRTILAWHPGAQARVAGLLPDPLRYAALAAVGGQLVIVGGTSGETASRDVYRFDPTTGKLTIIGLLPRPLTHAAAAALNGTVFVFGGRGSSPTSQTRRILAITASGTVEQVGVLPLALSDLAAVSLAGHVVIAGGRDGSGRVHNAILAATVTPA
jgi:N-acetylneuraminic acid mutarotase